MKKHISIPKNNAGRDFVIGDLHGHTPRLFAWLDNVGFNKERDRLFSVGDIIDRGPNSKGAVDLIGQPWFFAVRGNHEQMMIDSFMGSPRVQRENYQCWMGNGGQWALKLSDDEIVEIVKKLMTLPVTMEIESDIGVVGIIHAEPPPSLIWGDRKDQANEDRLLWGRSFIEHAHIAQDNAGGGCKGVAHTFHGHTPRKNVLHFGNCHWIDTGACFASGSLSLVQFHPVLNFNPAT